MRRIGFIGTENSHTDHFIRFLNTDARHPGYRATALAGGRNERNDALARTGDVDVIVDHPTELIGQVDAAIISTRDGALHREQAEPLLAAGLPIMVDKPLATSVRDAEAIVAAANRGQAPLVSFSALRFVPEIGDFAALRGHGQLRQLSISGPADPDSEYSGLFFYGIHHVETALELLGNPVVKPGSLDLTVNRNGDTTVALTRISEVDVVLTFIAPTGDDKTPFHAVATSTNGVMARELTLGRDYNAASLDRFVHAIDSGVWPLDRDRLVAPVAVLESVIDRLHAYE